MKYRVEISARADPDIRDILTYFTDVLCAKEAARALITRIRASISGLDEMPERHRLYDFHNKKQDHVRVMPVDSYLMFYTTDRNTQTVTILRILYERRNIGYTEMHDTF